METTAPVVKNNLKVHIHCKEHIPCNPCETACPFGAISVGEDITNSPCVDVSKCRGCGICVAVCPGLAIRLVDTEYSPDKGVVAFPYEYLPFPEKGAVVDVVDLYGKVLGKGSVLRVQKPLAEDPTRVVYVVVDKGVIEQVHSIKRRD